MMSEIEMSDPELIKALNENTQTMQQLLNKLDRPIIPCENQLWDIKTCAEYFGVSREYFGQYVASKPGFPKSAKIGHRKWIGQDVIDWALSHWDKQNIRRSEKKT